MTAKVTEVSVYGLKDETAFNPMALLELLKQICTTRSNTSGQAFKAYQEKETFTHFYVIGGWSSIEAHEQFVSSELGQKLDSFLAGTFIKVESNCIHCDAAKITSFPRPILAVTQHTITNRLEFLERLSDVKEDLNHFTDGHTVGGFDAKADNVFVLFSAWKTVSEHNQTIGRDDHSKLAAVINAHVSDTSTKHIEVNQFV